MDCRLAHRSDSLATNYKETIITATAARGRTAAFFFARPCCLGDRGSAPAMTTRGDVDIDALPAVGMTWLLNLSEISIIQPKRPERNHIKVGRFDFVLDDVCIRNAFNLF